LGIGEDYGDIVIGLYDLHQNLEACIKFPTEAKGLGCIGPELHVFAFLLADAVDHSVGVVQRKAPNDQGDQEQDEFPAAVLVIDGAHSGLKL